ncbi:MAG: bifunctional demethylmenaquinone methyltransferase/2-methoxy-6-polyprenyl-1,4-benzoquinol methylase UbiE [Planctomycetota bacterium]
MAPSGGEVRAMFSHIAPRYDLLNRVLSLGLDQFWRRRAVRALALSPPARILDVCCGTGDLSLAFARRGCHVVGIDFSGPMLPLARAKARRRGLPLLFLQGDALALPVASGNFDGASVAFGLRNLEDPFRGLQELHRILRPGGRVAILEFFSVEGVLWGRLFRFYFHVLLPRLARLTRVARNGAYAYLPASVDEFVSAAAFRAWIPAAGFELLADQKLAGGVARLMILRKPESRFFA